MPIVNIRALPQKPGIDIHVVIKAVSWELAAVSGGPADQVWVTWETIEPGKYLEGGAVAEVQPAGTHPPLVELIAFEARAPELASRMLLSVARALCRELKLEPGNAFITFMEAAAGRVFSRGEVRRA